MMFRKKMLVSLIAVLAVLLIADMQRRRPIPRVSTITKSVSASGGPRPDPAAPWGSVARGSKLLFDVINEEGGINGRKIKYFIRDDMYNPAQTAAVVKELVERQGVFAFVGGVSAAGGLAVKDYLAQNKVIWVGPATSVKEYVFPVQPYLFSVYPLYEDEASILTKYIVETLKIKKIGILYQNDSYGKNGLDGCKQRLATYKMSLVAEIPVEPTEKDLASQILRLKSSGAEAVLMYVNPTTAVITLKTAANVGFKPQWVSSNTLSDYPLMYKISGGLWEGVITGNFGEIPDSKNPLMVKYQGSRQEARAGRAVGHLLFRRHPLRRSDRGGPEEGGAEPEHRGGPEGLKLDQGLPDHRPEDQLVRKSSIRDRIRS